MNNQDVPNDSGIQENKTDDDLGVRDGEIISGSMGFQPTLQSPQKSKPDNATDSTTFLADRYEIRRRLGRGGMGEVLLANDKLLGREVAIKRLLVRGNNDEGTVNRFLNEAKSVASLNHQNVVQVYDYGYDETGPFIVMEFVAGGSLAERLSKGPMFPQEAAMLISNLCEGLQKAHAANLVHRDIKPANILLTPDDMPKLSDFGLVRIASKDNSMTQEGAIFGTPDYMAPEQRKDATKADARSDLWSVAATLYQMITGRSPRVMLLDDLPVSLRSFLVRALDPSPDKRFQNVLDFKSNLHTCLPQLGTVKALLTGVCPSCRAINEGTRKFCKDCAKSLRYKCLQCAADVPVWDEVCGDCGCVQAEAVGPECERISKRKRDAEELLAKYAFDDAKAISEDISKVEHPLLASEKQWASEFCSHVEATQQLVAQQFQSLLAQAKECEKSGSIDGAIAAIEQIPVQLYGSSIAGNEINVRAYLAGLTNKRNRSRELQSAIEKEQNSQSLYPILDLVTEFALLRPDRKDLQEAKNLLLARRTELEISEKRNLKIAKTHAERFEFEQAGELAAKIDPRFLSDAENRERQDIVQTSKDVIDLRTRILDSVESKKYDSLLELVDKYLSLKPNDTKFAGLRTQLLERDEKKRTQANAVLLSAKQLASVGNFYDAAKALGAVSPTYRDTAFKTLLLKCDELFEAQKDLLRSIDTAAMKKDYLTVLQAGDAYLSRLKLDGFRDANMESQLLNARRKESSRKKRIGFMAIGLAIGTLSALWLAYISYVAIQNSMEQARLQEERDEKEIQAAAKRKQEQQEEERIAKLPPRERMIASAPIKSVFEIPLKLIPEGKFTMGSPENEKFRDNENDAELQHEVTISNPFYLSQYEITQAQYESALNVNPSAKWKAGNSQSPIYNVSWYMAVNFCNRLSELENRQPVYLFANVTTGTEHLHDGTNHEFIENAIVFYDKTAGGYRLPTEAEWEYACRADTKTTYFFGESADQIGEFAVLGAGFSRDKNLEVGSKRPNPWGLYDMYGNVAELCQDEKRGYTSRAEVDPGSEGITRYRSALRGGSFRSEAKSCRSAYRGAEDCTDRSEDVGFRVARTFETPEQELARKERELNATKLLAQQPELNSVGMKMKTVPPGRFVIGGGKSYGRNLPQFRFIRLTKSFSLSTCEVTQEQFQQVLGFSPSSRSGKDLPATNVSWYDAIEFCNRLSELEGLTPVYQFTNVTRRKRQNSSDSEQQTIFEAKVDYQVNANGYRLPTSAEWEYACRAGSNSVFCFGDDVSQLVDYAWLRPRTNNSVEAEFIHEIGQKKPNLWGFFDMHGNASEWCWDYCWEYAANSAQLKELSGVDPLGPPPDFDTTNLRTRIIRGVAFTDFSGSGSYAELVPSERQSEVGFRVARNAK